MAELSKSGTPSLATSVPPSTCQEPKPSIAGEAIAAGDACYRKSDGKIWLASGAAANAAAKVVGFAAQAAAAGEAVTLFHDVKINYATGMTPGTLYYLSATVAGGLATVATTGGTKAIARAVDATCLWVQASWRD